MSKSEYLDSFEYMQGIAYRDAIKTDYYERLLEKQYEKENEYVWEYSKENSLKNDPTYQAWIIERGAPPDCARSVCRFLFSPGMRRKMLDMQKTDSIQRRFKINDYPRTLQ